ncbi:hypothetical protein FOA43_003295 [Brettanomyces nanus]|uniref:Uncharacterized protein n=1 Tax=Eeniella nana TaxID=13502 RepID=A0A875S892_EENNA|nr:uncharacterized protein FOA43_003295 [Brettanomyces nanus]QPG75909.1 hypothetical protein FOA43_003295 [Brettanomyces nanus]
MPKEAPRVSQDLLQSSDNSAGGSSPTGATSSGGAVIPPYPLIDTFATLTILMVLPSWLSVLFLLFYILLGSPKFFESSISLLFKHRLLGLHSTLPNSSEDHSVTYFLSWFSFDSLLVGTILLVNPSILEYTKLLAKAFLAARLTSTRHRQVLDAIVSCVLLLFVERFIQYLIKFIQLGDLHLALPFILHSSLTSSQDQLQQPKLQDQSESYKNTHPSSALTDLLGSTYIGSHRNPLKLLVYHLSFSNIESASRIVFGFDYFVEFFYSTLAVYTILHRISPFLSKVVFYNSISKSLDNITTVAIPKRRRAHSRLGSSGTSSTSLKSLNVHSRLPSLSGIHHYEKKVKANSTVVETINVPRDVSKSVLPSLLLQDNYSTAAEQAFSLGDSQLPNSDAEHTFDGNTSTTNTSDTPASFPLDKQMGIMNDISSSSLVVAQNFENYCRVALFPLLFPILNNNLTPTKGKLNPYLEKKIKYMGVRVQQPLWVFVNAARTMFGRKDLYSGDYYQHNAVVAADPAVEDYVRSSNGSPQCFVWYTGETAVAFELRNISLDQLLVRVNGIIWEHVSSAGLYGRELVMVNGLSPLSQYDIDFIKILDNGELRHFAATTVSTVHKNRTLTESKPSTPLATLQESVVTTQNAIDREKAKLKKLKNDWRKRSTALKSEIENLNNRSNMADESRNYKKVESLRQAVAKLDIEVSNLSKRFEEIYAQQTEVDEKYLDEKRTYDSELRCHKSFQEEHDEKIKDHEKKIKDLTLEKKQLLQKKDKLNQKKNRIQKDIEDMETEIEELKKKEIIWRQTQRKERSDKREQKYLLLMSDINKYEKREGLKNVKD